MVVNYALKVVGCTSDEDVVVYGVLEEGANLVMLMRFRSDTLLKNSTLVLSN